MRQQPLSLDDESASDLSSRVKLFLTERHYPALRNVCVEVHGDTVVLTGRVPTFHERQLAVASCRHVAGVYAVADRLSVAEFVPSAAISPDRTSGPAIDRRRLARRG